MANRQIARDLDVAPSTIDRQLARLGRHCLLFHIAQLENAAPFTKFVIDGLVSFEHSQYWPFHHHLAIEKDTDFMIYFTDSEVRRSGTMTSAQKTKRARLEATYGRPDPHAVFLDVKQLLEMVTAGQAQVTLFSDDHRVYPRVLATLGCTVTHMVTSSRERRTGRNPLFAANLADLLIRHSSANHKRETIAWSKRRQSSAERMAVFLVWRNYMKGRREKIRSSPTPAQARGMAKERLRPEQLLSDRLFPSQIQLPKRWQEYYGGRVQTRCMVNQRRHELKYAI